MATKKKKTVKLPKAAALPAPVAKKIMYGGQEYEIEIKPVLELSEVGRLVSDAVDMAVLPGDTTYPWLVRFAIDYTVVSHYTNVVLPEKADEAEKVIAQSNVIDCIIETIGEPAWRDIVNYVGDAVTAAERTRLGRSQLDTTLIAIKDFVDILGARIEAMDDSALLELARENFPGADNGVGKVFADIGTKTPDGE